MDLLVIETLNGGDLFRENNDLKLVPGWINMPYIAMFGGNVEQSTPVVRPAKSQDFSWWGNKLLMSQEKTQQFNSETERSLKNTPLTSAGRITIQNAVEKDLAFMKAFAKLKIVVSIIGLNKVKIEINVIQFPPNAGVTDNQFVAFVFVWDGVIQSLSGDFDLLDFNEDFF